MISTQSESLNTKLKSVASSSSSVNIDQSLENQIQELGLLIFEKKQKASGSKLNKDYWAEKLMGYSMRYPEFKIELFRLVDVLPSLTKWQQVSEHLRDFLLRDEAGAPAVVRAILSVALSNKWTSWIAAKIFKKNILAMAQNFITGEDSHRAHKNLEKLWNSGQCFTVDILGEAAVSENEAEHYKNKYLELIEGLPAKVSDWKANPKIEKSPWGFVPRANVSVKCSSLYSQIDNLNFRNSVDAIKTRLAEILRAAVQRGVFVNLDMEQFDYREIIMTVAEELFCSDEFKNYPHLGIVVQAYLKTSLGDIDRIVSWAQTRQTPLSIRLVKGAYWDYEVMQAKQRHWPVPVFQEKSATDANYEQCAKKILESYPKIHAAFGSHNVRSLSFAASYAEQRLRLPRNAYEFQMLYGMADPFKKAVKKLDFRLRDYAPVGEMLPGMAYLVRRLLENTSNEGFLRASFFDKKAVNELLKNPIYKIENKLNHNEETQNMAFKNEAFQDFSQANVRAQMEMALKNLQKELPLKCPVVINGVKKENTETLNVQNPSRTSETVCVTSLATEMHAKEAIDTCVKAMKTWSHVDVKDRIAMLRKAAQIMRDRKSELTATLVYEVAKSFREADADICEGIDFCDYYAQEMERLTDPKSMGSTSGELNQYLYRARGPALVIAPWNFPFAILCGMAVGPLVAGNTVILKPAEQSSGVAEKLYSILREAGIPGEALQLLPGKGEVVGAYLVKHPQVHIVNFTGSRAVGLWILENAAKVVPGQKHIKKVVIELGGKNAMIIDEDADLDEAVAASIQSFVGFQGQKCSALSRVLVHESLYDRYKERLKESLKSISIGPAENPSHRVGPVIDEESQKRILGVVERNKSKIVAQVPVPESLAGQGHYVPPTVFEESDANSELGQVEFFGPLMALFKVGSFDEAVQIMNGTDYALTGGIFSRSPTVLARARKEIEVGNLYINRGITGALVYKQPFGGFKLSGAGGKAGGPDYLLNFLEPQTVCENTARRGFAPEKT